MLSLKKNVHFQWMPHVNGPLIRKSDCKWKASVSLEVVCQISSSWDCGGSRLTHAGVNEGREKEKQIGGKKGASQRRKLRFPAPALHYRFSAALINPPAWRWPSPVITCSPCARFPCPLLFFSLSSTSRSSPTFALLFRFYYLVLLDCLALLIQASAVAPQACILMYLCRAFANLRVFIAAVKQQQKINSSGCGKKLTPHAGTWTTQDVHVHCS